MEHILDKARKAAEQAEVFTVSSEETLAHFEADRLKHIQSKHSRYTALRIIKDGRIGYATSAGMEDDDNLIDAAVETAQFGMKADFDFPPPTTYPDVAIYDPEVEETATEDMIRLGEVLIERVKGHNPMLICEAAVDRATVTTRIMNSHGGQAEYRHSAMSAGLEGQLVNGTDMLFVGDGEISCRPITTPDTVAESVIQQLERAGRQASIATKTMPVVFTPQGVASALTPPLMAAFNGKTVLKGASPLGDKVGETVFDPTLSLYDDPIVPHRPTSRPCDDEGTPSQRTPLIDAGRVKGFLYDLKTATMAGAESTGNGERHHGSAPVPSPSAFVISPGGVSFEEMIADIKEGLVIEFLMGAQQGNILGGDFSGNVLLGYKVESGRIVGRVKDTMVAGNVYRLLGQVEAIGSEARWVGGAVNTPPIRCPNLAVASK